MKTSLFNRLTLIVERYEELTALLGDMDVIHGPRLASLQFDLHQW